MTCRDAGNVFDRAPGARTAGSANRGGIPVAAAALADVVAGRTTPYDEAARVVDGPDQAPGCRRIRRRSSMLEGIAFLPPRTALTVADLEKWAREHRTRIGPGDVLLIGANQVALCDGPGTRARACHVLRVRRTSEALGTSSAVFRRIA